MDEINARIQPQSSICSADSNCDEHSSHDVSPSSRLVRRLCLVGDLANDTLIREVAETFGVPVIYSKDGRDYVQDCSYNTVFVLENFDGDVYAALTQLKQSLLGPVALRQLADKKVELPNNTRPLFNLAMTGVIVCFTGFRDRSVLASLLPMIHHMGGSVRKEMKANVTHLIANICSGEKYLYADTFRVPVMDSRWVFASWERRHDINFSATQDVFVTEHKLKPFHGAKVGFVGFSEDETKHMIEILLLNGGDVCDPKDTHCTHVVMERAEVYAREAVTAPLSSDITPSPDLAKSQDPPNYTNFLETLHEKSRDTNNCFDESNSSSMTWSHRKRKSSATDQTPIKVKRRKDKCVSEKKGKISGIFKTPINYFSHRRRTIDAASFDQSLNQSVVSSSGVFNVETIQNLSIQGTPRRSTKKNLFTRTFSSSKFNRSKLKKLDLSATRLSFNDAFDNDVDKLNASCFPNICPNPVPRTELRSECAKDTRGPTAAVVDEGSISSKPDAAPKTFVVKTEWFWTSVQKEICQDEKDYLYDDYVEQTFSPSARRESHQATPSSASRRKRKRLAETLLSLGHQQSPGLHKRRSSVSDAGLLSVSGSFLDCTASPGKALVDGTETANDTPRKGLTTRQQVFLELVQTESNYVNILDTIMNMFKKHLEEMPEQEALLNNTELNLIFGKLPAIYETHVKMLNEMRYNSTHWSEDHSIGSIIVKYSNELLKAYPPYINYFEEMKEVLTQCDQNKPRFHAFLKACQTRPECGRQSLQELMIRPVQRLGSICLLLASILKHTPKANPDHAALEKALSALKKVMDDINEDKRKAEAQVTLFNIFNDIDNCPPDIVSSHRNFIDKAEVIQLSTTEGLSRKGHCLMLFLFSDQLEVCKKKSKAFNNLKSPSGVSSLARPKLYKHVRLLPLNTIKKVIDIRETEQCQKVFCLVCRNNDDTKDRFYTFIMADEDVDKTAFLKILTRQMANNSCTPDADKFMAYLNSDQLDIDTSDINSGTLSKAFRFASKTRDKVGRAFSFNKTPSTLKRAMSSMMSPFGSSNNITPASELAQMRLASCNNINELGNAENASESPPVAPMSVQPTRKMKTASLNVNALKRL